MNDYFLRCQQSEVPSLMAMGVALGLLVPLTDDSGTPRGTYVATQGNALDIIGEVMRPTGATTTVTVGDGTAVTVPVQAPVLDPTGTPYWHANLRTTQDLNGLAVAVEGSDPAIAAAAAQMGAWFVVDANGQPTRPALPARVWF